jgi:hypothetical protein
MNERGAARPSHLSEPRQSLKVVPVPKENQHNPTPETRREFPLSAGWWSLSSGNAGNNRCAALYAVRKWGKPGEPKAAEREAATQAKPGERVGGAGSAGPTVGKVTLVPIRHKGRFISPSGELPEGPPKGKGRKSSARGARLRRRCNRNATVRRRLGPLYHPAHDDPTDGARRHRG